MKRNYRVAIPMRGIVICFFFFLYSSAATAQGSKYAVQKGLISFTSNAKLELIKAESDEVRGLIDTSTGQFAFVIKAQSFRGFNSDLQKQHFNEKYLETEKFYEATYTGKIVEAVDFSKDGVWEVQTKGNLIIHGKKQPRTIPGKLTVHQGVVTIESEFNVPLADHDIAIPQILSQKLATEILVRISVDMAPASKK